MNNLALAVVGAISSGKAFLAAARASIISLDCWSALRYG